MEAILNGLEKQYGLSEIHKQRSDLYFARVPADRAVACITALRDVHKFTHLTFLTAVDYIEQNIFELTYMLHSYETKKNLCILVNIDRANPVMESIHPLWVQASTYQRELKEMFGIDFPESPRVDESFILEGWDNMPPMRRDFDTKKYSEETFFPRPGRYTVDPREHMKQKLYASNQERSNAGQK